MISIPSALATSLAIASAVAVTIPVTQTISQPTEGGHGGKISAPLAINNQGYHVKLPVTKQVRNSIEKRTNTETQAIVRRGEYRSAYTVDASIGFPGPQKMTLQIDTGSSALWVASNLIPEDKRPQFDPVFEIRDGDVAAPGLLLNEKYLDGTWAQGPVCLKQVSIGGLDVVNHPVGMAQAAPQEFFKGYSGLLGLGVDDPQDPFQKTWFSAIKPELAQPLFAVDFRREGGSALDIGYVDVMAYEGEPFFTPRLPGDRWDVEVTGFSIGDQPPVKTATNRALVDTGSTFITLADSQIVADYYNSFGAKWDEKAEAWTFPCNSKVPDFSFWLGDHQITIPGSIMNRGGLYFEFNNICSGGLLDHKSNKPIVQQEGTEGVEEPDFHIIGMVALEALYVIFDATENAERVGFAYKSPLANHHNSASG